MLRLGVIARREHYWGIALCLAFMLGASSARAQNNTDSASARALFTDGRKLMAAKHFDQACPKLEESLRLDSGIGTMYNLADCWEHTGRTASAWAMFADAAAAARAAGQSEREKTAKQRATALEPKLAHLTLHVAATDSGLEIQRDGKSVGQAVFDTAVPVDPGTHRIEATAPGKKPFTANVEVAASASVPFQIPKLDDADVVAAAPSPAESAPATAPASANADSGTAGHSKVLPYTLIGVGVAGLAVGTVFEILSRGANSDALGICPNGAACTQSDIDRHDSRISSAKTDRTVGFVGLGVGAVSLVTGVVLLATGHSPATNSTAAQRGWQLHFDASAQGAAAVAEGRF